jgi:hypothetical protein
MEARRAMRELKGTSAAAAVDTETGLLSAADLDHVVGGLSRPRLDPAEPVARPVPADVSAAPTN